MIVNKEDIVKMIEVYKKASLVLAEETAKRDDRKLLKTFVVNFNAAMKHHKTINKDLFNWNHVEIHNFYSEKLNINVEAMNVCCRNFEEVKDILFNHRHPCCHLKIGLGVEGVVVE